MNAYNTKEGILSCIGSYPELYRLLRERFDRGGCTDAGPLRPDGELLAPFVILGQILTGDKGYIARLNPGLFTAQIRAQMPPVLTSTEFDAFFKRVVKPTRSYQLYASMEGISHPFPLPPPHVVCAQCGGTWKVEECGRIQNKSMPRRHDLSPYVGKTLREIQQIFVEQTDAVRFFSPPLGIHNPAWESPALPGHRRTTEQQGWRTGDSKDHPIDLNHIVNPVDTTEIREHFFYHPFCLEEVCKREDRIEVEAFRQAVQKLLAEAGFERVRLTRIPPTKSLRDWMASELCDGESLDEAATCLRCFRVETLQGTFVIAQGVGYVIDLDETGISVREIDPQLQIERFPMLMGLFFDIPLLLVQLREALLRRSSSNG